MEEGILSLKWNNHSTKFLNALSDLRQQELYTDVTIACENQFYPAHKLILSTCSDYFKDIFAKVSCKSPVIILKDIGHKDLESLLDYMYLGEADVRQTDLANLIKAAECLQIKGLAVPDEERTNFKRKTSPVTNEDVYKRTKSESLFEIEQTSSFVGEKRSRSPLIGVETIKLEKEDSEQAEETAVKMSNDSREDDFNEDVDEFAKHEAAEEIPGPSGSQHQNSTQYETHGTDGDSQLARGEFHVPEDEVASQNHQQCPVCFEWFYEDHKYRNHLKAHHCPKVYQCLHCPYKTYHATNLRHHTRRHTGEKPYSCPFCPYKSRQKISLKNHLIKHEEQNAP